MMTPILAPRYALSIAQGYATQIAERYVIAAMKTVEEVRRERLKMLRVEYGSLSALNAKLEMTARDSTLSQLLNGATGTKTKKPKEMGSAMARRLEKACGKEVGWMDTDPDLTPLMSVAEPPSSYATVEPPTGTKKGDFLKAVTPEQRELLDHFAHLLPSDRQAAIEEMAKLAKVREAQRREMWAEAGMPEIMAKAAHATRSERMSTSALPALRVKQVDPSAPELDGMPPPDPDAE